MFLTDDEFVGRLNVDCIVLLYISAELLYARLKTSFVLVGPNYDYDIVIPLVFLVKSAVLKCHSIIWYYH